MSAAVLLFALLFQIQQGPAIPPPSGYVNDFANVLSAESEATLQRIADDVRAKSKGEIVVVTLPDLEGRDVSDVALRIGRQWKVGAMSPIGDETRNTGTVILIVPKETASDNRGRCWISTGSGTEGFVTDGMSGEACREAVPLFQQQNYGDATVLVSFRIAEKYAREFGFQLDTAFVAPVSMPVRGGGGMPPSAGGISPLMMLAIFVIIMIALSNAGSRGRRGRGRGRSGCGGCMPIPLIIPMGGGHSRGGWGGGWSGGGGGFGGFGGGGGFSGGGGGSSW